MLDSNENVLFRKAGKGFNKEDVNAYILSLSSQITDSAATISLLDSKNKELAAQVAELTAKLSDITADVEKFTAEKEKLISENKILATKIVEMNAEKQKYINDCREKAGEILAIATEAAQKLVSDAAKQSGNANADAILDECAGKINASVDSVLAMKDLPDDKKPKVDF